MRLLEAYRAAMGLRDGAQQHAAAGLGWRRRHRVVRAGSPTQSPSPSRSCSTATPGTISRQASSVSRTTVCSAKCTGETATVRPAARRYTSSSSMAEAWARCAALSMCVSTADTGCSAALSRRLSSSTPSWMADSALRRSCMARPSMPSTVGAVDASTPAAGGRAGAWDPTPQCESAQDAAAARAGEAGPRSPGAGDRSAAAGRVETGIGNSTQGVGDGEGGAPEGACVGRPRCGWRFDQAMLASASRAACKSLSLRV
ncbi:MULTISPECIES: hypothetical protein [unclassified Variovorax]|uniref:hypothetical protein n=1 Tax=unclassified Variovorax TaxID=663243 RepID=UPI0025771517|nr:MULTISPECIES: hypothetical protein [unclassified Variovorax]MDM0085972.1 hypothetical protein [Variovorax sp. J22G40]MDM0145771.1 hypothetical protein [Variovorax sp. J2P1-31]